MEPWFLSFEDALYYICSPLQRMLKLVINTKWKLLKPVHTLMRNYSNKGYKNVSHLWVCEMS